VGVGRVLGRCVGILARILGNGLGNQNCEFVVRGVHKLGAWTLDCLVPSALPVLQEWHQHPQFDGDALLDVALLSFG
jgi:hypothetical protein